MTETRQRPPLPRKGGSYRLEAGRLVPAESPAPGKDNSEPGAAAKPPRKRKEDDQ